MFNPQPADDRSTKARIRDAAIVEIASTPGGNATVRSIAARADVSPGSVIHHFGSVEELRRACSHHVAALIRQVKTEAIVDPFGFNPLGSAAAVGDLPLIAYIANVARRDSPEVNELIDELVDDATNYLEAGVAAGTVTPSDEPRKRAALLVLWSLGGLVLNTHMQRLLDVDLMAPRVVTNPDSLDYLRIALDVIGNGILPPGVAAQYVASLEAIHAESDHEKGRQ